MLPSLVAGESRCRLSLVTTTCCPLLLQASLATDSLLLQQQADPLLLQASLATDSLLLQQHAALSCCRRVSLQTLSCYNNMLPSLVAGESRCRLSLVTTTCCPPSYYSLSLQHDPLLLQASLAADSLLLQQHAALSCCRRVSLQTLSCYNNMLPSLVAGESRYRLSLVTTTS